MINEYLKFYGDTEEIKNKLYTWKINSIMDLENRLKYWSQRVVMRAAWYVVKEDGKPTQSTRIDLVSFFSSGETLLLSD
jgi:hypothetical protein